MVNCWPPLPVRPRGEDSEMSPEVDDVIVVVVVVVLREDTRLLVRVRLPFPVMVMWLP